MAVVPARAGSKGLPGKNIRPLGGLPLIAHSIQCGLRCPSVDRVLVSTDSPEIAEVARQHGGDVPFLRPPELATDEAPMLPVLQHALQMAEDLDGFLYGGLLLLDPTSPGRTTQDVEEAVRLMESDPNCDGVVGVSMPDFNPYWHCVIEDEGGYMADLIPGADRYSRRQDVPDVWRINASLYLWRRDFLMETENWRHGRLRMLEIPESRAIHIDDLEGFAAAEDALQTGRIRFEWLEDDRA